MGYIAVDKIDNDGRTYSIGLEEIGFFKGRGIKSSGKVDGITISFAPKCELIIFSSTKKYDMHFASIYFETQNYGKDKFKVILDILKNKGLNGLIEYVKNLNPNNLIEKGDGIFSSSNTEIARLFLDFV